MRTTKWPRNSSTTSLWTIDDITSASHSPRCHPVLNVTLPASLRSCVQMIRLTYPTFTDILKKLKGEPALQQTVGRSVNNIRRSATGALVLQLKKGIHNTPNLSEELGKVLGAAGIASALQHTSRIEIKVLDECVTKEEITIVLDALLGVPVSKHNPVKSLRKAYAGTKVAVVTLLDN
ncbi:hypothetical protein TKK_0012448 [Trichogramma kaykai]